MDFDAFSRLMHITVTPGTVFPNPGGGSSELIDFSSGSLIYRRGNSRIYVSLRDLYNAYAHFRGSNVSSTDLRQYRPSVFDSVAGGHSRNCTMLFILLKAIGAVDRIQGEGVRGNPFWVTIAAT
jgi:hypothetical protein